MELRLYLRMVQRCWWIIAVAALVAFNAALVFSYIATPLYMASARFLVSPNPDIDKASDVLNSLATLDKRSIISTYAEFLRSSRILRETAAELGLDDSQLEDYAVNSVVLPDANILELTVEGPDPQLATVLTNAIGKRAVNYIKQYYQVFDITLLDPAETPTDPFSPQPVRDAGLALALGGIVGTALAILSEQIRIPLDALRQQRTIDSISSAFNRRHFQHTLENELANQPNRTLSLAIVQLDGLKDLIDTLPQPILQSVLRHAVSVLRNELRGNDVIGRWGDISLAVMLPSTPGDAAKRTLGRICRSLAQPVQLTSEGETLTMNPHVGIAIYQGHGSVQALIANVENAVAQAILRNDEDSIVLASDAIPLQEN